MVKLIKLTKLEERFCYDSWWLVETESGTMRLHQYDGMNPDVLKNQIESCENFDCIADLTPKHFYFD